MIKEQGNIFYRPSTSVGQKKIESSPGIDPKTPRILRSDISNYKLSKRNLNMKYLHLIIIIPASLLRLFSEGSSVLQLSSPVETSEKRKEIVL